MSHHHHDHSHGGRDHEHNHGAHDHSDDIEPALQSLLYKQIEIDKIITLNETQTNAGANIVKKTWAQRLNPTPLLVSDADEQLLMTVPFAGTVKLHSILLRSSSTSSAPRTLKLFINRLDVDFGLAADLQPLQTLELSQTSEVQDIPVKRSAFGNVYSLTLFFEDNFGEDATEIYYLAFKGEFTKLNREPIEVFYEAAANPKDHTMIVGVGGMVGSSNRSGM